MPNILETSKGCAIEIVNADLLADIKDVSVDKSLTKNERIAEYIRQIKNPHCFKCGKFIVKAKYADNGISLEDCLRGILI